MLPHLRLLDRRHLHVGRLFLATNTVFPKIRCLSKEERKIICKTRLLPYPVGKLNLQESLPLLKEYCCRHNVPFILSAVPEPAALEIQQLYGCPITELPDWGDYLYNAVDLATLVGHRFNKKRNRVNKFKSTYPDYRYEMITSQNLPGNNSFFRDLQARISKRQFAVHVRRK